MRTVTAAPAPAPPAAAAGRPADTQGGTTAGGWRPPAGIRHWPQGAPPAVMVDNGCTAGMLSPGSTAPQQAAAAAASADAEFTGFFQLTLRPISSGERTEQ